MPFSLLRPRLVSCFNNWKTAVRPSMVVHIKSRQGFIDSPGVAIERRSGQTAVSSRPLARLAFRTESLYLVGRLRPARTRATRAGFLHREAERAARSEHKQIQITRCNVSQIQIDLRIFSQTQSAGEKISLRMGSGFLPGEQPPFLLFSYEGMITGDLRDLSCSGSGTPGCPQR